MNEPATVLEASGCCLHCIVIDFLTVKVCGFDYLVDFSVEIARRSKKADLKSSWCDCVSVRNRISCCVVTEAVIGYRLAMAAEKLSLVVPEYKPVERIVLPVVLKRIGRVMLCTEVIGFFIPDNLDINHALRIYLFLFKRWNWGIKKQDCHM
jgi:hypothetical protein